VFGFIVRRLLSLVPLLIAVSALVFFMVHLVPGDPVRALLNESTAASSADIERLREQFDAAATPACAARRALYRRAARHLHDDAPLPYLYAPRLAWAVA
jgi:ABC-type dipeptide/oligopeptide/nickel transport system permease component